MFSQYEPNVNATISYLKQLKVKVNDATVNETLQNHPDWPSLLCIADSLNKWNIPNGAGKIDAGKIDELPLPFMAYTNNRENPLAIVTQINDDTVQVCQKKYNTTLKLSKEDFLKQWDGIYLIAEPDQHSGELNYIANKQKAFLNSLIPAASVVLLIILSFLILDKNTRAFNSPSTGIYLQYAILLAGVFVTALLLWYEIDKNNPLLHKVCTGIAKGNCNAILSGKQAKVFNWLSWSEVGFFYFAGSLLTLLFLPNAIALLAWLNILALPYTLFSIYYQWRVAKQWCVLCLTVQALLLLGGINVIVGNFLFLLPQLPFLLITNCLMLMVLPVLLWYAVKPYILRLQQAKNTKREYLRIKFNTQIFETLLHKQKKIITSTDGLGIDMGNPAAKNTIIKVCNPYCGPCATAHPKIEALLEQNDNVKAKIIFNTTNSEADSAIYPVRHLLAIKGQGNQEKTKQALDDWYLPPEKDYEVFAKKYAMNGELNKQGDKIERMAKWCSETGIAFTPTIFINGYQLPNAYSIEDLQYFLLE
ncbi:thioredoxin domain-containing protein [Ferruginibacter sp.]|nr:thioredoxin domain-containing protein [Ferruginibacter sp.]